MWLSVCKVNPRNVIQGNKNELVILQQTVDDGLTGMVEEIMVDTLVDVNQPDEFIDFEIDDAQAEDEFQCNVSSSDDATSDEDDDTTDE